MFKITLSLLSSYKVLSEINFAPTNLIKRIRLHFIAYNLKPIIVVDDICSHFSLCKPKLRTDYLNVSKHK
jgi:hypothetical protein